jgi:hydroxypyruvate isomerase
MLRFSANLGFLWPDRPLLDRIDAAASAGFRAIELHWPYEVPPEVLRGRCEALGLTLLALNTPIDSGRGEFGLGAVPGREADFRTGFELASGYARAAGASAVHVMAGVVPPGTDRNEAAAMFEANLRWAVAAAPDLGLLLEPLNPVDRPGYFYSRTGEAAAMVDRVGAANLAIMFDAYHVGMVGGDVLEELRRRFGKVGHVQIAAVPTRGEPDEGVFAFPSLFATLDLLGYQGWVGCEYRPRGDTTEGLRWLPALGVSL